MVMFIDFVRGGFISHSKAIARSCPGMLDKKHRNGSCRSGTRD